MNVEEIKVLFSSSDITSAVIIDDANDDLPTAQAVSNKIAEWDLFEEARTDADDVLLKASYSGADGDPTTVRNDDAYVQAVYALRDQLEADAKAIFQTYEDGRSSDLQRVEIIEAYLIEAGLKVSRLGTEFKNDVGDADLVVIDLYLGSLQDDDAKNKSEMGLRAVMHSRQVAPPLVLLISNNGALPDLRNSYRDKVKLLESGFRILQKSELDDVTSLGRQLGRLAENKNQTQAFAAFLTALDEGVDKAKTRTMEAMRQLKLSDIAQVRQLLLDHEEEKTGTYLVDLFDRSLQHEIECEPEIIETARAINDIDIPHYAPHVSGSPDLPQMVARALTRGFERWKPSDEGAVSLKFGDVLLIKGEKASKHGKRPNNRAFQVEHGSAVLVITAACDLVNAGSREPVNSVLFLVGEIVSIGLDSWKYPDDGRTYAFQLDDGLRCIKWDTKNIRTVNWALIDKQIGSNRARFIGRLREDHATSLQQKTLSSIGRVGMAATLPASIPVDVEAYVVGVDGKPLQITVDGLNDGGTVFVGTKGKRSLTLTERGCDELARALAEVPPGSVAQSSRGRFRTSREQSDARLRAGLPLSPKLKVDAPQKVPDPEAKGDPCIHTYWGDLDRDEVLSAQDQKKLGLILNLIPTAGL